MEFRRRFWIESIIFRVIGLWVIVRAFVFGLEILGRVYRLGKIIGIVIFLE